ncbi:MAG: DUF1549 domain-containing protein [Gemmataceae bacterium]|nr:DUF1549 domain-containing protein [Gemmataceae bacterium]
MKHPEIRMKPLLMLVFLIGLLACGPLHGEEKSPQVEFSRQVLPILADHCLLCHGFDEKGRKASLRLDVPGDQGKIHGGKSVFKPGELKGSAAWLRITSSDPDEIMPPPRANRPLRPEQKEILKRWIEQGAKYDQHWAFQTPLRPAVHPAPPEHVVNNQIDSFVGARLQKEGLKQAPRAAKETLLRRLSLDLTGLPPSLPELDSFLNDASPTAWEKQVERLLASPRYGERWARWWLDAARFADSDGYEKDLPRSQWPWRDWVIAAFNRDLPYDRFLMEQLAGDLLPGAGPSQRLATGFLRNSMVNEEGAILAEQFRLEGLIDRLDCLGKAVLGLTISCAQCHDHKYDPITKAEYYKLMAFINNDYEATSWVYTDEQQKVIEGIHQEIALLQPQAKNKIPNWHQLLTQWAAKEKDQVTPWEVVKPFNADVIGGLAHPDILPDGSILTLGFRPSDAVLVIQLDAKGNNHAGLRLEALTHGDLPFGGPGRSAKGTFAVSEMKVEAAPLKEPGKFSPVALNEPSADFSKAPSPLDPFFRRGENDSRLVGGPEFLIDGKEETAWSGDRGPALRHQDTHAVFRFAKPVNYEGGARFKITLTFKHAGKDIHGRHNQFLGRMRIALTSSATATADPLPPEVRMALPKIAAGLPPDAPEIQKSFPNWRTTVAGLKEINQKIAAAWSRHPEGNTVLNLAARQGEFLRQTRILDRGDWQKPLQVVSPGTPTILHKTALPDGGTRLDLARWLTDKNSPTTARVAVNRAWQSFFGNGLVATPEDFGTRAAMPPHRELLDWLACEFMEPTQLQAGENQSGKPQPWSFKHLHRLIVCSATYQQASAMTPHQRQLDPRNLLLARGPRFRVEAEILRDIALSTSGLMNPAVGGPSIFPPVPDGFLSLSYLAVDFWNTATGPERYRRSLYVFRRRSIPDPVMSAFDAPNGDTACVRRERSNTPLAALVIQNEPVFVECAQSLGLRVLREGGATDGDKIRYLFRLLVSRPPREEETAVLQKFLQENRHRLAKGEINAHEVAFHAQSKLADLPGKASPNEAAAWVLIARLLYSLDEVVNKN